MKRIDVAVPEADYVFVGNRPYVLDCMLRHGLAVLVLPIAGSYLENVVGEGERCLSSVSSKQQLTDLLSRLDFDILVSNGCPYILPVSKICREDQVFVNIHPSPLPDLRGADPVPGAILYGRDSGASCHIMDDSIDSGPLISRVTIGDTSDVEARLLYQMTFLAEVEAFEKALSRNFRPDPELLRDSQDERELIYYTKKDKDRFVDLREPAEHIVRRVRAFSNRSQGAVLDIRGVSLRIFDAKVVKHPYLLGRLDQYVRNEVIFCVEDMLLIRHDNVYLQFDKIVGDLSVIRSGQVLQTDSE